MSNTPDQLHEQIDQQLRAVREELEDAQLARKVLAEKIKTLRDQETVLARMATAYHGKKVRPTTPKAETIKDPFEGLA